MKRFWPIIFLVLALCIWSHPAQAQTSTPVVHAVLFYSPSCGHCHYVITEVLPPLIDKYGEQFLIVGVDVSSQGGQQLFLAALTQFELESAGVPFLVIGDTYLVGSVDIPNQLPILIEQCLLRGGLDWPAIPGLMDALEVSQPQVTPSAEPTTVSEANAIEFTATLTPTQSQPEMTPTYGMILPADINTSVGKSFTQDLAGNSLAVFVLVGMVGTIVLAIVFYKRLPSHPLTEKSSLLIPMICLVGMGVAGYLAYVEMNQVEAFCGPVGDCNSVQQSEYTLLFGILPIGLLGLMGYFAILLTWLVGRYCKGSLTCYASLALLAMSSFGLLFSIYLTFLEPFIIGATCAWCLTSAILMTILFWVVLPSGKLAVKSLATHLLHF